MSREYPIRLEDRAAMPLKGKRVSYEVGDLFELQTKAYVRDLGPLYGIEDSQTRPFKELPYVKVVNVLA